MVQIKRENGGAIGMIEAPTYIRLNTDNGCFNLSDEAHAQGIVFGGQVYHLFGREKIGKDTVLLEHIDSGRVLDEFDNRLADTDAMTIDQEYKITLLELGITDFDEEEI